MRNPCCLWHVTCIHGSKTKSEWPVTWTANALCDEAPHEVGAVLTPVWPSKRVYLGSQQTCSYTHSNTCQLLPVITTVTLNWRVFTGGMFVWDPVPKRTRPQTTAFVCARQIKGFTKMCLASAAGQSDTCAPGRSQNNRCTPAAQRGEKARSHTCRRTHVLTHTHTPYKDFV